MQLHKTPIFTAKIKATGQPSTFYRHRHNAGEYVDRRDYKTSYKENELTDIHEATLEEKEYYSYKA